MSADKTGGPAFPALPITREINGEMLYQAEGITIRDYFAAKAINAILGQYDFEFFVDDKMEKEGNTFALVIAKNAYEMADAMLEARK
jgi:hypothetical protein